MSYTILSDGKAIHCGTCGRISHNANDVQQRYCAHCNKFHVEEPLWGVFEDRTGNLLVADDRETECRKLKDRWHAIAGADYTVRLLTVEEARVARSWKEINVP